MQKKILYLLPVLIVLGVGVELAVRNESYVDAAPPGQRQLILKDANGVSLGYLLDIENDQADGTTIRYHTYLPAIHSTLSFQSAGGSDNYSGVTFTWHEFSSTLLYDQSDCTGNAYLSRAVGESTGNDINFYQPIIVSSKTINDVLRFFKGPLTGDTPTTVTALSRAHSNLCENISPKNILGLPLVPVTLPFNFEDLQLPFTIVEP